MNYYLVESPDLEDLTKFDIVTMKDGTMFQPEGSSMPYPVATIHYIQEGVANVQVINESGTESYMDVPVDDLIGVVA